MSSPDDENQIEVSSGNLYADLGFADPELEEAKAMLAREIRAAIAATGLSQSDAGKQLGISQADISRITRGRLGGYSIERLLTLLRRLDLDVEITVTPTRDGHSPGHIFALAEHHSPRAAVTP